MQPVTPVLNPSQILHSVLPIQRDEAMEGMKSNLDLSAYPPPAAITKHNILRNQYQPAGRLATCTHQQAHSDTAVVR